MTRPGSPVALHEAFTQLQAEIERLAFAAARAIIEQELARRRAKPAKPAKPAKAAKLAKPPKPAKAAKPRPARRGKRPRTQRTERQLELGFKPTSSRQLELSLAQRPAPDAEPDPAQPAALP